MKKRALLAREKAKSGIEPIPEKAKEDLKVGFGKISLLDPDTKEVVKVFDSIEQAVAEGFNKPNIVGAIKGERKYKGHLWTSENELT
jgi:hypothetical protein